MADIRYTVQRPGEGTAVLNAFRDLARSTPFNRLTGLFAFASAKGIRVLIDALEPVASWNAASKRWVISIDGGITEPEALRLLLRQRKTEVRVHDGDGLLARNLKPIYRFHPKTLLLERQTTVFEPAAILVGSANLTCSGLCFGHEHVMTAQAVGKSGSAAFSSTLSSGLKDLENVIVAATKIDLAFVDRYDAIRPARPTLPEDFEGKRSDSILQDKAVIPPAKAAALASAANLWIEVRNENKNFGSNREGNQIDAQKGTRVFFGGPDGPLPDNTHVATILIRYNSHSASTSVRFGDNDMDKIGLPIPSQQGPPSYRNQTLLFSRESDGSYRLTLGSATQIAAWKQRSRILGTLYRMRRGREYGVF